MPQYQQVTHCVCKYAKNKILLKIRKCTQLNGDRADKPKHSL